MGAQVMNNAIIKIFFFLKKLIAKVMKIYLAAMLIVYFNLDFFFNVL